MSRLVSKMDVDIFVKIELASDSDSVLYALHHYEWLFDEKRTEVFNVVIWGWFKNQTRANLLRIKYRQIKLWVSFHS